MVPVPVPLVKKFRFRFHNAAFIFGRYVANFYPYEDIVLKKVSSFSLHVHCRIKAVRW
jgi:hypothetical protein